MPRPKLFAAGRLSTCARCGTTIERTPLGWGHLIHIPARSQHTAEPDDSALAGPDDDDEVELHDCCDARADDDCDPECDCDDCEAERALDDDADSYLDRCRD